MRDEQGSTGESPQQDVRKMGIPKGGWPWLIGCVVLVATVLALTGHADRIADIVIALLGAEAV